jgi:hypothetical protein
VPNTTWPLRWGTGAPAPVFAPQPDSSRTPTLEHLADRPARAWFSQDIADSTIPPGEDLMLVLEAVRPSIVEWLRVTDETGPGEPSFGLVVAPRPNGLTQYQALPVGALPFESRVLGGTAAATVLHLIRNAVDYQDPEWYVPAGQALWVVSVASAELISVELQWREVAP